MNSRDSKLLRNLVPALTQTGVPRPRVPVSPMNEWEQKYAQHLRMRQVAGEVRTFEFEAMRLRMGIAANEPGSRGSWFTPDFSVWLTDGSFELHEVKGFWREAARVRIKTAASLYPFRFVVVRKVRGGCFEVMETFN